jgi:uncharacterized ion transporter superfamily protein YfcC
MRFPSAQSIILVLLAFVAVATWLIPSGKYDVLVLDDDGKTFIQSGISETKHFEANQAALDSLGIKIPIEKFLSRDVYKPITIPNTYKRVPENPQGIGQLLQAPIKGVIATADIIFMVLIIGGLIGIVNLTGAFNSGIAWLSILLKGKEHLLIIFTTSIIAIGGTTFSFGEETLAFYPILLPVFLAARYDAMVAVATIYLGSCIGCMCATISPFSTIIASDIAGINWTTGLAGRVVMLVICTGITLIYILRYAKKVKTDPRNSILYKADGKIVSYFNTSPDSPELKLTPKKLLILIIFACTFLTMILGISLLDWWFIEMTTTFFIGALIIGFVSRLKESEFILEFCKGAGEMIGVTLIIGFARGVFILMDEGMISDTVLYYASSLAEGMSKIAFVNVLFLLYNGLNFLIPSTSGMSVLSMPIMAPLADSIGVGREVVVNTLLYGMGTFTIINPTSLILPSLAMVKVGYDKWLKFIWPLILILMLISMISISFSVI